MQDSLHLIKSEQLESILASPLIDSNCAKARRCIAVYQVLLKFTMLNLNVEDKNWLVTDNMNSAILSSVLSNVADPNLNAAVIEFVVRNEKLVSTEYEIYSCADVLDKMEKNVMISEGATKMIIRIHTKHGSILVPMNPGPNFKGTNEKKKRNFESRLARYNLFISACKTLLTNECSDHRLNEKQNDSEIIKWEEFFLTNIKKTRKYPDFFTSRRGFFYSNERKDISTKKRVKTSDQNQLPLKKNVESKVESSSAQKDQNTKCISAADVVEMVKAVFDDQSTLKIESSSSLIKSADLKDNKCKEGILKSSEPPTLTQLQCPVSKRKKSLSHQEHDSSQHPKEPLQLRMNMSSAQSPRHEVALVEGNHYVCWFDSQSLDSQFCYLKLDKNPDNSPDSQHIPYKQRNSHSNVIRIPFETSSVDFIKRNIDFINVMKGTNVRNILPPPTNLLPPWNPNYENLFIMEAGKSVPIPSTGGQMLTRVEIWKYAYRSTHSCMFHIRTPSPMQD